MDIAVHTGLTKTEGGEELIARSFVTKGGEQVFLLVQMAAGGPQARNGSGHVFLEECERVTQHALLETEGEGWGRLDGALKELNGLMKGLLLSRSLEEVHAIVALVSKDGTLHVSHAGRGEAYLVRGGSATQITEFSRGKPLSAFVHISSGGLENGDAVVAATQRLLRAFTPAQLAQAVQRGDSLPRDITRALEAEGETAAFAVVRAGGGPLPADDEAPAAARPLPSRRSGARRMGASKRSLLPFLAGAWERLQPLLGGAARGVAARLSRAPGRMEGLRDRTTAFLADLKHPQRKRRAHMLLLAGALAAFLVILLVVKLSVTSQRSKTRTELSALVQRINQEIKTAENRRLAGDTDAANDILTRADAWAKQVMDNENNLFRVEALDLLDRIRGKREEINNIARVSPRVLVNLAAKNGAVTAQGMIGLTDGEFIVYDRTQWYHVLLNGADDPRTLADDGLILDGAAFPRFKSQVFLTTGNAVLELQGSQPVSMKTEDLAGWVTGKDAETYLRYLYILGTDNGIYKYERLQNRYGAAVQYNVNGDLTGALDMAIDSSIYVLKEGGTVVKLLRGEAKPFQIRHAPPDALKTATRIVKMPDRNFYFLDPVKSRVVIVSGDDAAGEAGYLKQYVLEGEQVGKLQDLYVDPDESHLYVLDEKRVYVIDLVK